MCQVVLRDMEERPALVLDLAGVTTAQARCLLTVNEMRAEGKPTTARSVTARMGLKGTNYITLQALEEKGWLALRPLRMARKLEWREIA